MSTNGRREEPAGDDGFGGSGLQLADDDAILDDPEVSGGDEFEIDPGQVIGGFGAAPDTRETDPWAGFSDETRALAEAKGWSNPEEMGRAYRNAEQLIGSRDTDAERRAAQAEAQLRELISRVGAGQPQQQPQQEEVTLESIFQPIDYDELERVGQGDPKTMMAIYHEQVALPQMKAALAATAQEILKGVDSSVGSRLAPVEDFTARSTVRDQVRELADQYPTRFAKHRAELTEKLTRNPDLVRQPGGVRAAFNELVARDVMAEERAARSQEGETLLGGRRSPSGTRKPVDIDAMIREEIDGAGSFVRDGLG